MNISNQNTAQSYVAEESRVHKTAVVEIVNFESGQVFYAQDYSAEQVYLIAGDLEVYRREQVPQLMKSMSTWKAKDTVFRKDDRESYARCQSDCQLMLVRKADSQQSAVKKQVITEQTDNVTYLPIQKPRSIDIKDLIDEEPVEVTAGEPYAVGVEQESSSVLDKLSGIKKQLVSFIQRNVSAAEFEEEYDEKNLSSHTWLPMVMNLPTKNGLYYTTDGKKLYVAFYNSKKKQFHTHENVHVKYWSRKKVSLDGRTS